MEMPEFVSRIFRETEEERARIECEALELKKEAEQFPILYHCTDRSGLEGILTSRELWLSRTDSSNDGDEIYLINGSNFKDRVFTGSFFPTHKLYKWMWGEYGNRNSDMSELKGIVIGIKPEWFDHKYRVVQCKNATEQYTIVYKQCEIWNSNNNLYDVQQHYVTKVHYDHNAIKQNIPLPANGTLLFTECIGISKKSVGWSIRSESTRNWSEEEEIRLVVLLSDLTGQGKSMKKWEGPKQVDGDCVPFTKIAVKFVENAFDDFDVYYGPDYNEEEVKRLIEDVKRWSPPYSHIRFHPAELKD